MPLCTGAEGDGEANLGVVLTFTTSGEEPVLAVFVPLGLVLLVPVPLVLLLLPVPVLDRAVVLAVELVPPVVLDDPQPATSATVQHATTAEMPVLI